MLIHGDNLLALKALEQDYAGQVKCIYIDPPYNTGNAFEHYDDGVEHSIWLSLMRERLVLLRNLLSDDGSIWISIDADESHYLKVLCDEIFGRSNFIDEVIWQRVFAPVNLKKTISRSHDAILVYCKNANGFILNGLKRSDSQLQTYKNLDNDPRGPWTSADCTVGPAIEEKLYEIITPSGRKILPPSGRCWLFTKERLEEMIADNRIWFGKEGNNAIPDRFKECLDARPHFIPAGSKPGKYSIRDSPDRADRSREYSPDSVPDRSENLLHPKPGLIPVSGKESDKNIEDSRDHAERSFQNSCNGAEGSFKYRRQYLAEAVPDRPDQFCNSRKRDSQRAEPFLYSFDKAADSRLDPLPCADDRFSKSVICFP
jgi:hypothetical protein